MTIASSKTPSPWKTLKKSVAYQNPWIKVYEDKVIRPDRAQGIYGYLAIPDGVGVVAMYKDKSIHLVGEWRYPINRYFWSVVCGTLEKKEAPLNAAKRELEEETGLKSHRWTKLAIIHPSPGLVQETAHLYLAKECTPVGSGSHLQESTEKFGSRRISLRKAIQLIRKGEISDSYAVCSILLANGLLRDEK